jgi:hypothetical protein
MSKDFFIKLHWFFSSQIGIDVLKTFKFFFRFPFFLKDYFKFKNQYKGVLKIVPCIHDRFQEGGETKSEYFWQDLLIAKKIFHSTPLKHVDIGSRIDGFIAHLASFREVEVFDVRPITSSIPGVKFRQVDFTSSLETLFDNYTDSISCLHTIEHFGLGRYGDPINPKGYVTGFANMARLLKPGGFFYLSCPVGLERVEFNANYIFSPFQIYKLAQKNNLYLKEFFVITPYGSVAEYTHNDFDTIASKISSENYNLIIFIFKK